MKKEVIAYKDSKSPISEIFRTLRTNIQFMNSNKELKSILITSTIPGEGKSYVAVNLAVTFAQTGKKVLLLDADMRKGRQYAILGALPKPGLSNYLSGVEGGEDLTKYIQITEIENLYFMPAGNIPPNPSELLITQQMLNLIDNMNNVFDVIIIDGTPCELVTDAVVLSRMADTTVIVAEYNKTKKDTLKETIKKIQNVGGNIAGIIINKINVSTNKYEQAYYYGSSGQNNKINKIAQSKKINTEYKLKKNDEIFNEIKKSKNEPKKYDMSYEKNKYEKNTYEKNKINDNREEILKQVNEYLSKRNKK